jgi:hypothetical protein
MSAGAPIIDSQDQWGIVCKGFPFKIFGKAKDLPSQKWPDEHGVEEYVPKTLFLDSYDMEVEFAYKGSMFSANLAIISFLNYLTGLDGTNFGAELLVYDTYTQIGRRKVRFLSTSNDLIVRNEWDGDLFTFTVTFRVNDPVTDIFFETTP